MKASGAIASSTEWSAPPRLLSDQLVHIFFQEWAPLFPVIHRPTFLALYEEYTSCPESMTDKTKLAQLNLVFGLAASSQAVSDSFCMHLKLLVTRNVDTAFGRAGFDRSTMAECSLGDSNRAFHEHSAVSHPRPALLHPAWRLQQAVDVQGFGHIPFFSPRTASVTEALRTRHVDM